MGNILNLEQLTTEMLQTLSKAIPYLQAILLFEDPGIVYLLYVVCIRKLMISYQMYSVCLLTVLL